MGTLKLLKFAATGETEPISLQISGPELLAVFDGFNGRVHKLFLALASRQASHGLIKLGKDWYSSPDQLQRDLGCGTISYASADEEPPRDRTVLQWLRDAGSFLNSAELVIQRRDQALKAMRLPRDETRLLGRAASPKELGSEIWTRVVVARQLMHAPRVLLVGTLLDSLENTAQQVLVADLQMLARKQGTIILVATKQSRLAALLGSRIAVFYQHRLVAVGPRAELKKLPVSPDVLAAVSVDSPNRLWGKLSTPNRQDSEHYEFRSPDLGRLGRVRLPIQGVEAALKRFPAIGFHDGKADIQLCLSPEAVFPENAAGTFTPTRAWIHLPLDNFRTESSGTSPLVELFPEDRTRQVIRFAQRCYVSIIESSLTVPPRQCVMFCLDWQLFPA